MRFLPLLGTERFLTETESFKPVTGAELSEQSQQGLRHSVIKTSMTCDGQL